MSRLAGILSGLVTVVAVAAVASVSFVLLSVAPSITVLSRGGTPVSASPPPPPALPLVSCCFQFAESNSLPATMSVGACDADAGAGPSAICDALLVGAADALYPFDPALKGTLYVEDSACAFAGNTQGAHTAYLASTSCGYTFASPPPPPA